MNIVKTFFQFTSSNGINTIKGFKICKEQGPYKAIIQISHGMVEHVERYEDFMTYMANEGYVMYAHDHLGHKNSVEEDSQLGFFAHKNGYKHILSDLSYTAKMAKEENPELKLFLLGHSMGSFYARVFAAWYGNLIDGLIISGTGGSNKMAKTGKTLVKSLIAIKGEMYRSKTVANITFKGFLSKIDSPTSDSDWISRDHDMVKTYIQDPYCQFIFTLSGFNDLMDINILANSTECYRKTNTNLPIFIFSGSMDPVGNYGIGVMEVLERYQKSGCKDIAIRLYDGGRHEMLNETNRIEVYEDISHWLNKHI